MAVVLAALTVAPLAVALAAVKVVLKVVSMAVLTAETKAFGKWATEWDFHDQD